MTIKELYKIAVDIPEDLKFHNKYTWLIYNKVIKGKFLDINSIFTNKTPIDDYLKKFNSVLLFPNFVNGWMVDLIVKPLDSKDSVLTFDFKHLPYGIGEFRNDFKFGDPIFLVEGIADWAALKLIKHDLDVVAIRSNSIPKDSYSLYASLTNKIILILDSDEPGKSQVNAIKKRFSSHGVDVYVIDQFGSMKDTGEFVDLIIKFERTKDLNIKEDINIIKNYFLENFKNY